MVSIRGRSLAGAGYVVLNIIRAMNITALLAVVAASSIMLVRMFNTRTFFFFDACENLIRAVIAGFLIITETPLFKAYFCRHWPLFSPVSGFVMLGVAQILLGNGILANLNKSNASQENLGMAFWRLIISSGIIVFTMGFINILASYIFRDTTLSLTARQVRSNGAVAGHKLDVASSIGGGSTPKSNRKSFAQRFSRFIPDRIQPNRDSLPSYKTETYMAQVQSPVPPVPALPSSNTNANHHQHTASGNLRMPHESDYHQHNHNEKMAQSPGAASSKYSINTRGEDMLSRPDLAHHPAMTAGYAR
ncbi:hypothetical protein LTS08_002830 [Lithohypha guttulata]|nr:hypothetical protein LTS08_002830 [Lithohypha guttulata]